MTFKELKKRVSIDQKVELQTRLFDRLDNRPFWIWNAEEHRADLAAIISVADIFLRRMGK
jgi:hypothetical protein